VPERVTVTLYGLPAATLNTMAAPETETTDTLSGGAKVTWGKSVARLAERLARGGLGVAESLALVGRAAEGLAVAHERGGVHRDLKPSNPFLVGDDAAAVKARGEGKN
jgi:hypothetical protein